MRSKSNIKWRIVRHYQFNKKVIWGGRPRPERMYQKERTIDPDFVQNEIMFIRIRREWIDEAGKINKDKIRFSGQSLNRSKYSNPNDVLLPDGTPKTLVHLFWGVASFPFHVVPRKVERESGLPCIVSIEHDPIHDNYSHCELRGRIDGKIPDKIPRTLSSQVRTSIIQAAIINSTPLI